MKLYRLLIAACSIALASCQTAPPKLQIPGSFPSPAASVKRVPSGPASASSVMSALQVSATPSVSVPVEAVSAVASNAAAPALPGPPISVSIENMPIPKFINEIYGELLHVNFQMDPALDKLTDLVTLRIPKAVPRIEFYRMATAVLRTYGLSARWDGQFVRIQPVRASEGSEPPLIISGRALPSVPESHRPIFQMVDLKYVRASDAANWLRTAYKMEGLSIDTDVNRNSIILFGKPAVVLQAAQAIAVLDRPYLRGHFSARLTPVFISATELAAHLTQILNAEGYAASNIIAPNSSVLVLPIQAVNSVIVFAPSESILEHVEQWAKSIDKPAASPNGQNFFYYQVRNTRAAEIASVLQGASGAGGSPVSAPQAAPPGQAARQPAATGGAALSGGGNLLVDQPRNALIFRGSADEWARLEPLIREMDRPARQVMVEVTIAEVTLDKNEQFGVNWMAKDTHGYFHGTWTVGTLGTTPTTGTGTPPPTGTTSGSGGLTYLLDVAGQNRAQLQALAASSRVSILSTPRILVTSGSEASIDVGNQVPIITSQTTSNQLTAGSTNLLQSVEYRNTGVLLTVKPTVFSDNRVDLDINQEVSQAQPAQSGSGVNSPSIFQRKIKTTLTLKDGGSVVLGGLVSNQTTTGNNGVPILKDIPVLGNLFKSSSRDHTRTELVVIIVPYIIEDNHQAEEITRDIVRDLSLIKLGPKER